MHIYVSYYNKDLDVYTKALFVHVRLTLRGNFT